MCKRGKVLTLERLSGSLHQLFDGVAGQVSSGMLRLTVGTCIQTPERKQSWWAKEKGMKGIVNTLQRRHHKWKVELYGTKEKLNSSLNFVLYYRLRNSNKLMFDKKCVYVKLAKFSAIPTSWKMLWKNCNKNVLLIFHVYILQPTWLATHVCFYFSIFFCVFYKITELPFLQLDQ